MPLNNCEINLILAWSENKVTRHSDPDADHVVAAIDNPKNPTFQITDAKLYVPAVTLSTENYKKLKEQLRKGFERAIKWIKYRSEMTNQTKNNNLNDPTFTKVNRLFVLSFENQNDRTSFSRYYVSNFQIKVFNVFINGKCFF